MKKIAFILILLTAPLLAIANENDSSFGIGISTGAVTGSGIDVVKYFNDYYVHASAMFIYEAQGDSFKDVALVAGKYLHKEEILSFGLPVGFKMFGGVNLTDENDLRKGIGFGLDFFNPGKKGVSVWYDVSYGTPNYIDSFAFYNAIGIIYNF